jgi:hypothetical protein
MQIVQICTPYLRQIFVAKIKMKKMAHLAQWDGAVSPLMGIKVMNLNDL